MAAVSVATTATRVDSTGAVKGAFSVAVYNNGAATVYLEKADTVTTATGYPLAAGQHISFDLERGEALWGIVASGTVEVRTIEASN